MSAAPKESPPPSSGGLASVLQSNVASTLAWLFTLSVAAWLAYDIRLFAIRTFGTVIHEVRHMSCSHPLRLGLPPPAHAPPQSIEHGYACAHASRGAV